MIREIQESDLPLLLELYLHLHEKEIPDSTDYLRDTLETILKDDNHHIIVYTEEGKPVSSCVCVVISNLTRGARPYALIENVVTHEGYRGRGYATACLNYAKELAEEKHCYKMMLLTDSKEDATLRFYESAGYNRADKTAFIQWLE